MQDVAAETYNGWKNYETWCVNLWLSNDDWEEIADSWLEQVAEG